MKENKSCFNCRYLDIVKYEDRFIEYMCKGKVVGWASEFGNQEPQKCERFTFKLIKEAQDEKA